MAKTWILLGMMGAGKSSVGRALADLTQREFADTDQILQQKLGRPISQIFELYGESAFRDHETKVLSDLEPAEMVLATGGGIVSRTENREHLRRLGITIYLKAEFETLTGRLEKSKKKRPLLEVDRWQDRLRALLDQRIPLYEQADVVLEVDGLEIHEVAERVSLRIEKL